MRPIRSLLLALVCHPLLPAQEIGSQESGAHESRAQEFGALGVEASPLDDLFEGTLLIGGGGRLPNEVFARFAEAAGGTDGRLVVIPTASRRADEEEGRASILEAWNERGWDDVTLLHTRDPEVADSMEFTGQLDGVSAVWIGGGDQNRLASAYRGTKVLQRLKAFLDEGGVIGGSSAGAAIVSDPMIGGGREEPRVVPGFGLLDGAIVDQHFSQRGRIGRLRIAVAERPGSVGLGVDEKTCLVVSGRSMRVIGNGAVTVLAGSREWSASADSEDSLFGAVLDLVQLRRAAAPRPIEEFQDSGFQELRGPENGTLVIVGGGRVPDEVHEAFLEAAGGADRARIIVVPTAIGGDRARVYGESAAGGFRRRGVAAVSVFHEADRSRLTDPRVLEPLRDATGIWFTGGRQWRLVDAYEGTPVEESFRGVLDRGGVIGGSSAGASIQAERLVRGHPLGNTVMEAPGYLDGFGYLRGAAIDQHFSQRDRLADLRSVVERHRDLVGFGIDEGTAVVARRDRLTVLGTGRVAVLRWRKSPGGELLTVEWLDSGDERTIESLRPGG